MPKLSTKALEKRFKCDYCGETVRTRQGLSGHIQFKHQAPYKPVAKTTAYKPATKDTKAIDTSFILSKKIEIDLWRNVNGLSKSTSDDIVMLFVRWGIVRGFFNMLDIELTEQDFKTYLLAGMVKIFS
jgi:hypothetical protein